MVVVHGFTGAFLLLLAPLLEEGVPDFALVEVHPVKARRSRAIEAAVEGVVFDFLVSHSVR